MDLDGLAALARLPCLISRGPSAVRRAAHARLVPHPWQRTDMTQPIIGVGLRPLHYQAFLDNQVEVDWLEVHAENYFADGGWDRHVLEQIAQRYPLSLHGVGLGLGSVDNPSEAAIERLATLCSALRPIKVSEHLCWSSHGGRHFNDLLPLPMVDATLTLLVPRLIHIQQRLGRQLLIENLAPLLRYQVDQYSEAHFLCELARHSGCGILLDLSNLYVNAHNHGESAFEALDTIEPGLVGEIHLAGFSQQQGWLIDDHGSMIEPPVWDLYQHALHRFGPVPTMIEWDVRLPGLDVLLEQVEIARALAARCLA